VAEKKPAKLPPATTPGKGSKQSKTYDNQADDLLSQLDAPNTGHKANARSTQAGSANGVAGGAVNGSAAAKGGWIDKVKAKITPLVQLPPDLSGNPKVVVLVTLLPTLEVSKVQVIGPAAAVLTMRRCSAPSGKRVPSPACRQVPISTMAIASSRWNSARASKQREEDRVFGNFVSEGTHAGHSYSV
jgi:membrane protein involved in colicin uptake